MDGSGKTTAAHRLTKELGRHGIEAAYFYGHRPSYHKEKRVQFAFSLGFKAFWRRIGRVPEEFVREPRGKAIYDWMTFLDHLIIQWKLFVQRRPERILIVDRYVIDILAYLRWLGPTRRSLEARFLRWAYAPDASLFFRIPPEEAYRRKQEQTPAELERFAAVYARLLEEFPLRTVDASLPPDDVQTEIRKALEIHLGFDQEPAMTVGAVPARGRSAAEGGGRC